MNVKKIVLTGLFAAVGVILPMAFHTIPNAGTIFLPMHIPVLLCGLICGWQYGLLCGIFTPMISSILTGMPVAVILPAMIGELAAYGFTSGLLINFISTKSPVANIYISLLGAMFVGKVFNGILNAFIFQAGKYSLQTWLTSAFVKAVPGLIIQIVLIPFIVLALQKTRYFN